MLLSPWPDGAAPRVRGGHESTPTPPVQRSRRSAVTEAEARWQARARRCRTTTTSSSNVRSRPAPEAPVAHGRTRRALRAPAPCSRSAEPQQPPAVCVGEARVARCARGLRRRLRARGRRLLCAPGRSGAAAAAACAGARRRHPCARRGPCGSGARGMNGGRRRSGLDSTLGAERDAGHVHSACCGCVYPWRLARMRTSCLE